MQQLDVLLRLLTVQGRDGGLKLAEFLTKTMGGLDVESQFALVVKANHPLASVRNALTVIFFVPRAVVFDQALLGYCPGGSTKGNHVLRALHVEVDFQLLGQPLRVRSPECLA